jgi:hypothetical protein
MATSFKDLPLTLKTFELRFKQISLIVNNKLLLNLFCNFFSASVDSYYFLGLYRCAKVRKGKSREEGETEIAFFGSRLAPTNIAQNRRTTHKKIGGQNRRREKRRLRPVLRQNKLLLNENKRQSKNFLPRKKVFRT